MTTPAPQDWESRSHVRTLVLLGATMLGVYLCYRMAKPFTAPLAWAVALAVVFAPLQRWLESRMKRPNLAAALSVLVIGLMVVVPAIFVGQRMIIEAAKGAQHIETIVKSEEWRRALDAQPRWAPLAERIG